MSEFKPTKNMIRAKSAFWNAVERSPMIQAVEDLSLAEVAALAGTVMVPKWAAAEPAFKDWFRLKEDIQDRIAYGAELAVDTLIDILGSTPTGERGDPVTTANQLAAAKELLAYSGHKPADKAVEDVTPKLPEGEAELRKYIAQQAERLRVIPSE